jgi:Flp pilus assembly protein TadG
MNSSVKRMRSEEGAAAVEFALLLLPLVLLMFGTVEFGIAIYAREVLVNASREGARAGIVSRTPKLGTTEVTAVVNNALTNSLILNPSLANVTINGAGGAYPATLSVAIVYPYSLLFPSLFNVGSGFNLTAQTVMVHE